MGSAIFEKTLAKYQNPVNHIHMLFSILMPNDSGGLET